MDCLTFKGEMVTESQTGLVGEEAKEELKHTTKHVSRRTGVTWPERSERPCKEAAANSTECWSVWTEEAILDHQKVPAWCPALGMHKLS